jgi:hypothetical protein
MVINDVTMRTPVSFECSSPETIYDASSVVETPKRKQSKNELPFVKKKKRNDGMKLVDRRSQSVDCYLSENSIRSFDTLTPNYNQQNEKKMLKLIKRDEKLKLINRNDIFVLESPMKELIEIKPKVQKRNKYIIIENQPKQREVKLDEPLTEHYIVQEIRVTPKKSMNLQVNNLPEQQQASSKLTRSNEIYLDRGNMESQKNYVPNKFSKTYRTNPNESQNHDTFYKLNEVKRSNPELKKRNPSGATKLYDILPPPDKQTINELVLENPIETTHVYDFSKDQFHGSVSLCKQQIKT